MSLDVLIENSKDIFKKIKELDKQKWEQSDKFKKNEGEDSEINFNKRMKMFDEYDSKIDTLNKKIISSLTSILQLPEGINVENIEVRESWGSKKKHPANIQLSLSISDDISKKISFGEIYSKAYELKEGLPELRYSAEVTYDTQKFLSDTYFDPRAFTRIRITKEGTTFTEEPFLLREDIQDNVEILYNKNRKKISIRGYRSNAWGQILPEIAKKFGGKLEVLIGESDYRQMIQNKSFMERFKTHFKFISVLQKKKLNRKTINFAKALMTGMGFPLRKENSWKSYEGIITADELEGLEKVLGTNLNKYISVVNIDADSENESSKIKDTLQRIVCYLSKKEIPGTSPKGYRISKEKAQDFLQQDLEQMCELANKIPLSSYFVRQRPFTNSIIEGSEYEKLHLQLLRKLDKLSLLNLENLFPNHKCNYSIQGESNPDAYLPVSIKKVKKGLGKTNLPLKTQEDIIKRLENNAGDYFKEGYLNIHDLYTLQIETINLLHQESPKKLFNRYLKLYKDCHAGKLSIECSVGERSDRHPTKMYHPFTMGFKGNTPRFEFKDTAQDSLNENYLVFFEDKKNKLRLRIIAEDPSLLPLQKYTLELMGIKIN